MLAADLAKAVETLTVAFRKNSLVHWDTNVTLASLARRRTQQGPGSPLYLFASGYAHGQGSPRFAVVDRWFPLGGTARKQFRLWSAAGQRTSGLGKKPTLWPSQAAPQSPSVYC